MEEDEAGVLKKSIVKKRKRIRSNFSSSSSESDSAYSRRIAGNEDKKGFENGEGPSSLFGSDDEIIPAMRSRSISISSSSENSLITKKARKRSESRSSSSSEDDKKVTRDRRSISNSNSSEEDVVEHQLTVPDISDDESADEKPQLEREVEVDRQNGYPIFFCIHTTLKLECKIETASTQTSFECSFDT